MKPALTLPLSFRMAPADAEALDRVARTETRSRAGQIIHYVRQGLIRDGYLPDPKEEK